MRVRQTILGLFAMGGVMTALTADDKKPLTDNDFVMKAATGGMHEVELGKIAATNASDAEVKTFGERMVADHTKANEELKTAAAKAGIAVPDKLSADKAKELDKFRNLKGAEFDKAYMAHMVKDHDEDVALFTRALKELKDPGLKGFVEKTLPTLKEHQKLAKTINDKFPKQ
jgi:putative membrane protein